MQGRGLRQGDGPIDAQLRVQRLQHVLAPGEIGIAWQGNGPTWSKRGETGFEKLTSFQVIELQVVDQFQDQCFAFGEVVSLLPTDQRPAMNPDGLGQRVLREALMLAKRLEQESEGR